MTTKTTHTHRQIKTKTNKERKQRKKSGKERKDTGDSEPTSVTQDLPEFFEVNLFQPLTSPETRLTKKCFLGSHR